MRSILIILILQILALIGIISLLRILSPEIYVISLFALSTITVYSVFKNKLYVFITSTFIIYLIITLSWSLSSNFTILPRDDPYHYYMFTEYVYQTGYITVLPEYSNLFASALPSWPNWHVILVSFSYILGITPYVSYQVIQTLSTAPLILLILLIMVQNLLMHSNKRLLYSGFYVAITAFSSFIVFVNTNPVSRALGFILFLLSMYIIQKIYQNFMINKLIILIILMISLSLSHPAWALVAFLFIFFTYTLTNAMNSIKGRSNLYVYIGLILFITSFLITAIFSDLATKFANLFLLIDLNKFISNLLNAIPLLNSEKTTSPTLLVSSSHFEQIIYYLMYILDFLPHFLLISSIIILLKLHKQKSFITDISFLLFLLSMSISSYLIFVVSNIGSNILYLGSYAYVAPLIYVTSNMFSVSVMYLYFLNKNEKILKITLCIFIILYILTAGLSLGNRSYQATFIWSSHVSFEERGMHSPDMENVMTFCNKYCDFHQFNRIIFDDKHVVFLPIDIYLYVYNKTKYFNLCKEDFSSIDSNSLIISSRNFLPTYWDLRYCKNYTLVHFQILDKLSMLYDNFKSRIYYKNN